MLYQAKECHESPYGCFYKHCGGYFYLSIYPQLQILSSTFTLLFSRSYIRNKARLSTLSELNTTSAWLKAMASPFLGLAIPCSEFLMAAHLWLGIPIVSASKAFPCACSLCIDQYGDHLLGCGRGRYWIRGHDILRDMIHSALQ